MNKMNICFLEGDMSRRGGTERMTAVLANAFCKAHQVSVVSLHSEGEHPFFALEEGVQQLTLHEASGKLGICKQIQEIRGYVRAHDIDWIINVDVGMSIYGIPAARGTRARVITWEHANYFNNWDSKLFPYFRKYAAKRSNAMVVLTERDRENYLSHIRTKTPVYAIPNPAQHHEFCYDAASKTILSAGLLLPIKGYDRAIQAAAQVLPRHPDWKWVICGEGPERARLEQLIAENGLKAQVLLPGTVGDMDEQYQKASMFVMTSEMEGLPMVLLEAKSWGLPLVSFDIMTGPSDIIRSGVNGYLVEPYDVNALAERIEELIVSQERRVNFSGHSQLDMERFDFEKILEKWQEIMED